MWFAARVLALAACVHGSKRVGRELEDSAGLIQVRTSASVATDHAPYAVVRPFWSKELHSLEQVLVSNDAARPCHGGPLPVDLVLYYSGVDDGKISWTFKRWIAAAKGLECYQSVKVHFAGISDTAAYPAGPCAQFVGMFTTTPAPLWGYSSIFLMELDEQPVRRDWLQRILPVMERSAQGDVWVIGGSYNVSCMVTHSGKTLRDDIMSKPMGEQQWGNTNGHINGNAVYSSNPLFVDWVLKYWVQGAGWHGAVPDRCMTETGGAYDSGMFLAAQQQGIKSPDGKPLWRRNKHFMNCKPGKMHRGQAVTMNLDKIAELWKDVVVVHSDIVAKSSRPVHTDIDWLVEVSEGNESSDDS